MEKYKKLFTVTAIVLAVVLTLGLILGIGYGVGWFGSKNEEGEAAVAENVIMNNGASNGIQLLSTQITPNDAGTGSCTITATIEPATTEDQTVTMSLAWNDASSDWASGKTVTDYVTVTQATEGALTATIECSQAFGEQIILTVTSNSDTSVYADATIDYVKRVTSAAVNLTNSSTGSTTAALNLGEGLAFSPGITLGTGTITGEISYSDLYYGINSANSTMDMMLSYWSNNGLTPYSGNSTTITTNGNTDSTSISMAAGNNGNVYYISYGVSITALSQFVKNYDDLDSTGLEFLQNYSNNGSTWYIILGVDYTYTYNGVTYGSDTLTSTATLTIPQTKASSVNLDENEFIF